MKKILIIILLIPILGISQNFTNKFKTDSLEYRIDSTNTLLSQFTFADCNGANNLNVKVCEPLNISDTTHQSIFNEINNNIQNIYNIINTSSSLVGSNATTINLHTTTTAISISNVLEIIVENIGSTNTTITYGGVSITLNAGQQRLFTSVYDEGVKRYTPIPSLTVVGTASSPIVVTRKVFQ